MVLGGRVFVFYVISVSAAAGLVGSFFERLLAALGFIPGFTAGLYITLGVAALYGSSQFLFLAVMRMYQPTRTGAAFVTEGLSNLCALVLAPYVLAVPIPWPSSTLERAEPILFAGVFVAFHLFFKMATFYASLRGPYDPARPILRWLGAFAVAVVAGGLGLLGWRYQVERARESVTGPPTWVGIGTQYARGQLAPEGATLSGVIDTNGPPQLGLRIAPAPEEPEVHRSPERAYVTFVLEGDETKVYETSTSVRPDAWTELLVPADEFPRSPRRYEVRWTRKSEPNWQRILGLRPIVYDPASARGDAPAAPYEIYVSGPYAYSEAPDASRYNLLLVLVDGLGANHVSLFGYEREATPAIDRLGYRADVFPNTYVPGKDAAVALDALLTGRDPAALGASRPQGPGLPQQLREAGYSTVAFLEADAGQEFHAKPWAEGFELIDEGYAEPQSSEGLVGSAATVAKVRSWVSDHRETPFFCVVRLRELSQLPSEGEYKPVFHGQGDTLRDVDRFDNALVALDRQLGALFKYVRDHETRSNTCIVLTAPYGHEFSLGSSGKFLGLRSERVPLIIEIPGGGQRRHPTRVELQDLGVTLAGLAGVRLPQPVEGENVLR